MLCLTHVAIVKLHTPEIGFVILTLALALSIGSVGSTAQDEVMDVAQSATHATLFTCSLNYE